MQSAHKSAWEIETIYPAEFFSFPLESTSPNPFIPYLQNPVFSAGRKKASTNSIVQLNSSMALEIC